MRDGCWVDAANRWADHRGHARHLRAVAAARPTSTVSFPAYNKQTKRPSLPNMGDATSNPRHPHNDSASPRLSATDETGAAVAVDVQSELEATTRHLSRLLATDKMMMAASQGIQLHPRPQRRWPRGAVRVYDDPDGNARRCRRPERLPGRLCRPMRVSPPMHQCSFLCSFF